MQFQPNKIEYIIKNTEKIYRCQDFIEDLDNGIMIVNGHKINNIVFIIFMMMY